MQKYASSYTGNPRSVDDVKKFILSYFLSAKRYQRLILFCLIKLIFFIIRYSERALYHHFTVAVDTNNIKIVFKDVKDTILKKNLDALLLQ